MEGIAVGAGEMGGKMEGVVRRVHVHGAGHPLRRWQVLIVETKRAEGRNGATAVVELAPVPVHGHQRPHFLPVSTEMPLLLWTKRVRFQEALADPTPVDGLGGMRTQPMLPVEMVEISLLRGEGRGGQSAEIGRTGRQGTAIKKAVPHPRRDTTGRMLSAMVSQRMAMDMRDLGLAGLELANPTAL